MTDKRFDIQVGLIRALAELGAEDAKKIEDLERDLLDAYQTIAYLISRFGEDYLPGKKVVQITYKELLDAPMNPEILRWDDMDVTCLGVRKY